VGALAAQDAAAAAAALCRIGWRTIFDGTAQTGLAVKQRCSLHEDERLDGHELAVHATRRASNDAMSDAHQELCEGKPIRSIR
jgi:hypothetical protein